MAAVSAAASRATASAKQTRGGAKNYSSEEINALFESIRRILPTGNDQWELVADLHSVHFACCNRSGESIKKKIYKLANSQPRTGNPYMSPEILRAKEIKEAINVKAGVTEADVSEFFEQQEDNENEEECEEIEVGMNEEQLPVEVTASVSGRRSSNVSAVSSSNQSTSAAVSANNKKREVT